MQRAECAIVRSVRALRTAVLSPSLHRGHVSARATRTPWSPCVGRSGALCVRCRISIPSSLVCRTAGVATRSAQRRTCHSLHSPTVSGLRRAGSRPGPTCTAERRSVETIEGPPPRPRAVTCMLSVTRSQTFFGPLKGMMAREMNLRLRPPQCVLIPNCTSYSTA